MSEAPEAPERSVRREVIVVFCASAALTAGLVLLGNVVPFIGQNVLALVALVFLYLPVLALRRAGREPADFGLDRQLLLRGARTGLMLTLITVPPFLLGFHFWESVAFDHRPDISFDNYRALPESLRAVPPADRGDGIFIWRNQRHLIIEWRGLAPVELTLRSDGRLTHRGGPLPRRRQLDGPDGQIEWILQSRSEQGRLALWIRDGDNLQLWIDSGGEAVDAARIWAGGAFGNLDSEPPITLERSILWIPLSLLIQLLLVALPEEFFYRGYIQTRLDSIDGRRFRLGPFHTSPAIIITSALFAVGHFIVGFDPVRLSVFFPALVFGWLRDRTGGLGAPIVYHAACNLMVEMTVVHYWPG